MRFTGRVDATYPDAQLAHAVRDALAPDDDAFVRSRVEGVRVSAEADAATPEGLLRSLDDFLACLVAAEAAAREATEG